MLSGLRWVRPHGHRRFPVASAPYAPPPVRPCSLSHLFCLSSALRAVFRSAACGRLRRVGPGPPQAAAPPVPSTPWGVPFLAGSYAALARRVSASTHDPSSTASLTLQTTPAQSMGFAHASMQYSNLEPPSARRPARNQRTACLRGLSRPAAGAIYGQRTQWTKRHTTRSFPSSGVLPMTSCVTFSNAGNIRT